MKIIHCILSFGLVGALLSTGGCSINPNSSKDFRASVHSMQTRQTHNPAAASVPPSVQPADGGTTANVVDSYREASASKGDSVSTEININVGN